MSIKENKKELRRMILTSRDELETELATERSIEAAGHIIRSNQFRDAEHIMVFSSFRSEIDTSSIIRAALTAGKKLYLPLSMPKTLEIVCCLITKEEQLTTGEYGILEPGRDSIFIGDCLDLELIIVPGAAFDLRGNRIGYGAGYYDRLLSRSGMKATTMGLGYELQLVDEIPASVHDRPLDFIATEKGVRHARG